MTIDKNLGKRSAFSVLANVIRAAITFSTGVMIARWLGPESYGNMAFLLGVFVGVRQLLDMGSSAAFFTFLSQTKRSKYFVFLFFRWMLFQFFVPLLVIALFIPDEWVSKIWQNNERELVLLAFIAVYMQSNLWPLIVQLGESQRRTLKVQGLAVIIAIVNAVGVWILWGLDILNLYSLFALLSVLYGLFSFLGHYGFEYSTSDQDGLDNFQANFSKYTKYCLPMIPYAWLSFAYIFLDRWLLQEFGGNLEQAFYGVGAQFAAVSLIATSAMLRVFWKEMAESHERGDTEGSRILYLRISRSLFFVGTAISGFVIPWTSVITEVALGDAYLGGTTTLMIMFLYPVHQSIGQIGGAMLMATEHVVTQVYIGLVFMAVSMLVTYFVLAPASAYIPGLGAGSVGLAVKMVGMQFVQVNILGYIISRIWKWKFDWFYQFISLGGCMLVGLCAHQLSILFVGMDSVLLSVFVAGVIYAGCVLSGLWFMPWLLGLTTEELKKLGNTVLLKLRVN